MQIHLQKYTVPFAGEQNLSWILGSGEEARLPGDAAAYR